MKGTVTISLEDYHKLIESDKNYTQLKDKTAYALKELEVFVSFVATRAEVQHHIEEFNRQSKSSKIVIENGRAIIQKKDDIKI